MDRNTRIVITLLFLIEKMRENSSFNSGQVWKPFEYYEVAKNKIKWPWPTSKWKTENDKIYDVGLHNFVFVKEKSRFLMN